MTGIDHQPLEIRLLYHRFQHFFPDALVSPATETPLDSIPLTIFRRQVSPWCSRSQNPEHAIQKLTGILCVPSPRSLVSYCVRLENFPHRIGHIVPSIAVLHEETPLCVFLHYTTKRHFCRQCLERLKAANCRSVKHRLHISTGESQGKGGDLRSKYDPTLTGARQKRMGCGCPAQRGGQPWPLHHAEIQLKQLVGRPHAKARHDVIV